MGRLYLEVGDWSSSMSWTVGRGADLIQHARIISCEQDTHDTSLVSTESSYLSHEYGFNIIAGPKYRVLSKSHPPVRPSAFGNCTLNA